MKSLASRRYLSRGIVAFLIAFGMFNAVSSAVFGPAQKAQPIALHSTQQFVEPTQATVMVTSGAR